MSPTGVVYIPVEGLIPAWHEFAACGGQSTVMYPPPSSRRAVRAAREICWGCPVLLDCRVWSIALTDATDPGGVLAGSTEEERADRRTPKRCTMCRQVKPLRLFYRSGSTGHARRSECKACSAERAREARLARQKAGAA